MAVLSARRLGSRAVSRTVSFHDARAEVVQAAGQQLLGGTAEVQQHGPFLVEPD
jgi:hypothetical protein